LSLFQVVKFWQRVLNLLSLRDERFVLFCFFFSFRNSEGSTIWIWKGYLIWVFENHSTLLFSLGWVWLWIFKILKSSIMKWGWVLTFRKCQVKKKVFEKVKRDEYIYAYIHYDTRLIPREKRNTHPTLVVTLVCVRWKEEGGFLQDRLPRLNLSNSQFSHNKLQMDTTLVSAGVTKKREGANCLRTPWHNHRPSIKPSLWGPFPRLSLPLHLLSLRSCSIRSLSTHTEPHIHAAHITITIITQTIATELALYSSNKMVQRQITPASNGSVTESDNTPRAQPFWAEL
jgi:hypothetical protein